MKRIYRLFSKHFLVVGHVYPETLTILSEFNWAIRGTWDVTVHTDVPAFDLYFGEGWAFITGFGAILQLVCLVGGFIRPNRAITMTMCFIYLFLATLLLIAGEPAWHTVPVLKLFIFNFLLYLNLVYD